MSGRRRLCTAAAVLVLGAAILVLGSCGKDRDEEKDREVKEKPAKANGRVSRTADGDPVLRIEPAAQARVGLRTETLAAQTMQPEVVAYGRLEEDPSRSFILRAPVAGSLHVAAGRDWPSIGEHLADHALVGMIEPRLAPAERISLTSQLAAARSELNASTAAVTAARAAYDRARTLNADNKNVSDRAVEDAEARLKAEQARLNAATDTVRLIENSLQSAGPAGEKPLTVERGGDVVEIMAQPGESIEPGSPVLRVARLDRLIARVDLPVGERVPASVWRASIVPLGYEDQPIPAERIALAATVEPKAQGGSFLFRLSGTRFGLRPGLAVTARIAVPGQTKKGVVIPRSAIVRVTGKSFVYLQTGPDQFVRKEVPADNPAGGGYFITAGFAPGARVVVEGAQVLLSEEFKSQTAEEE